MKRRDVRPIHDGERLPILQAIKEQSKELMDQDQDDKEVQVTVTCPCGAKGPLRDGFRCFDCHIFFCPECMKDHLGRR